MRIISGSRKSRIINPGKNFKARPTTDFAKENLFNVLNNHFDLGIIRVLDLFSGTGSISYEFASRGCPEIEAVEINYKNYSFIKKNAELLGFNTIKTIKEDAFKYIKYIQKTYDIIFADPPFDLNGIEDIPDLIYQYKLLHPEGWLIIEHSKSVDFSSHSFYFDTRQYGSVHFSFFKK